MVTAVITANAQFFVEGSVDFKYQKTEVTSGGVSSSFPSTFSYSISPRVGYWLNNNIAVGINPTVSVYKMSQTSSLGTVEDIMWDFSAFGRYRLWGTEKLSLLIETPAGIIINPNKSETEAPTFTQKVIHIDAYPLISYALTERFSIITRCNFLKLGFSHNIIKDDNGYKQTNSTFGFNAQSTAFNSLGNISIGFTYNF